MNSANKQWNLIRKAGWALQIKNEILFTKPVCWSQIQPGPTFDQHPLFGMNLTNRGP